MKPWKRIEPTKVTNVGWRTIVHKQFITNRGKKVDADIANAEGTQAAGVIALTPDNRVVIARQFRAGPEKVMDEIPGGLVDPGEEPEQAAHRELLEEVGYEAGSIEYLGKVYKDGWNAAVWHFFLATNCVPHPAGQNMEDTEDIEVDLLSIPQLIHNAKNGKMTDSAAVLLAYDQLMRISKTKQTD